MAEVRSYQPSPFTARTDCQRRQVHDLWDRQLVIVMHCNLFLFELRRTVRARSVTLGGPKEQVLTFLTGLTAAFVACLHL